MGYFHIGTLKCLIEAKCLPQIISGASAGSLMASFIAVRTDQEVLQELCVPESERFFRACEEPTLVKLTRWLKKGYAFDKDIWREHMRRDITKGDTTFLEAYTKYGRIINIATTATSKYAPTLILNYRSTPDVVIWSAVLASSAFPNFLAPIELQLKNPRTGELEPFHVHGHSFTDGTIKNDIPIKALAKMWNTNYNIVSVRQREAVTSL
jgi:predicted acylesterase/phospholipase RssA